jgi:hypothetical protein
MKGIKRPSLRVQDRDILLQSLQNISPTCPLHFPQHEFESHLNAYAQECGVRVDRGVELTHLESGMKYIDNKF